MGKNELVGWQKLLSGYPWFDCKGCYPLTAYSEFMPPPLLGRTPLGEIDHTLFPVNDHFGWQVSEMEEVYQLRPGIGHIGTQIMARLVNLGKGLPEHFIHGHGGQNLKDNPYWPAELAAKAGKLNHERYVSFVPLMLSRTQDDKGRVNWTFFGGSIHGPEVAFWKSFYTAPGNEISVNESVSFFTRLLANAYGEKLSGENSLLQAGFRILPTGGEVNLPSWTKAFTIDDAASFEHVKYLLTFRPFGQLPGNVKELYFKGKLSLLPFPGSLVFWGMKNYLSLQESLPLAGQLPLLHMVARNRGIHTLRVPQAGWLHEPHPDNHKHEINQALVLDTFHRTHRWERVHRHQDELSLEPRLAKVAKVLFSTELDAMGLYDKPLARNSHIWTHDFQLLLNGPKATRDEILKAEEVLIKGGLFGYRFFYPPMRVGVHDVYWHRPLVAYLDAKTGEVQCMPEILLGYITAYHTDDTAMQHPEELWPRLLWRTQYVSAFQDFNTKHDHYAHQTSLNILALLDAWHMQDKKPLSRSYAHRLLNLSKHKTLEQWIDELTLHSKTPDVGKQMQETLEMIIEPQQLKDYPQSITYSETATRQFEENWWNDIHFLAHGEFINKDNADCIMDDVTMSHLQHRQRDLESLGDYLIGRHRKSIAAAGMEGKAFCGELAFNWQTDFDFSKFGGWKLNQEGQTYERNILVVIPGKNRGEAVVMGDHYDTAYMEDIYEKSRGGSGARISANGADDNYSATSTILQAAPILLKLSKEGKLERDVWLIHLTGEEFPSDCLGARNFCKTVIEKNIRLGLGKDSTIDLSNTRVVGVYVMDMIGHNRENDQDIFQISPGKSRESLILAYQAHLANMMWNTQSHAWNQRPDRLHTARGTRITGDMQIPVTAKHLPLEGEVRTQYNPHSSIFNTDGQIFSDVGIPVVLFMENYDINRSGYHDTKDTMDNIDLDYGAAFAAIAIETVARVASLPVVGF